MDSIYNYEITDFHTHPFEVKNQQMCMYEQTSESMEQFRKDMEDSHIKRFAGSVIEHRKGEYTSFEQIRNLNDTALRLREKNGSAYIPGFHVHPAFAKESVLEIRRMHAEGVRLIGELVPYMMQWDDYNDERMQEVYAAAEEYGMIVSLHTMQTETLEWAVKEHPGLTFVAAHPGQRDQVQFHIGCMQKYPNYYLDLSGTGIFRYGVIKAIIRETGKNNLLFGTDYPITNPYMYVNAILGERLSMEDNQTIFSGNARKLLGL